MTYNQILKMIENDANFEARLCASFLNEGLIEKAKVYAIKYMTLWKLFNDLSDIEIKTKG